MTLETARVFVLEPYEHMALSSRFVLTFVSGEGQVRMGLEEGSGEPEEAWGVVRQGTVRLRRSEPRDRGGSVL